MRPEGRARQGDLFSPLATGPQPGPQPADPESAPSPTQMPLERHQLLAWQERLAVFQRPLWSSGKERELEQASLFASEAEHQGEGASGPRSLQPPLEPEVVARTLQPLALPAENLSFWRWPQAPHEGPALYLVLDRPPHLSHPLLLYVGETARADRRWKGAHDCKSYLAAYREALHKAGLTSTMSIRFWCEAPAATTARRALEQALIQRWKPPFNKETRVRWSTPFTAEGI